MSQQPRMIAPRGNPTPPGEQVVPKDSGAPPPLGELVPPPPPPSSLLAWPARPPAPSGAGTGSGIFVAKPSPAKRKGEHQAAAPKIVQASFIIKLEEISVASDSGWREFDQRRVAELVATFEQGEYKQNIMSKPAVLSFSGRPVLASDGLRKLADGKHTIMALKECLQKYDPLSEDQFTDALVKDLDEGVDVSVIEFEEDSDDLLFAWAAAAHDVDSNKYKPSAVKDIVGVATRFKTRVLGGGWVATQKELEKVYGVKRRNWVYRMVASAKEISGPVLEELAKSRVPNSYVMNENRYFTGAGANAPKK